MLAYRQGQIIFPERKKPVGFFFPVFINAKINSRCLAVDIAGYLPGRIKCFGISKIVYKLCKIPRHLICII